MRTKAFRRLAGVIAALLALVFVAGDVGRMALAEVALFAVIACLFALYAALGQAAADRWLGMWFGVQLKHVHVDESRTGETEPKQ